VTIPRREHDRISSPRSLPVLLGLGARFLLAGSFVGESCWLAETTPLSVSPRQMGSAAVVGLFLLGGSIGLVAVAGVRGAARVALTDFVESSGEGSTELVGGVLLEKVQTGNRDLGEVRPRADD
jgi:hypothetical protein